MKFSGSSPRVRAAKATIMVATAPQRTAPELSDSLVYIPLRVNNRVPPAGRKQPFRTTDTMRTNPTVANGDKASEIL